jgi:hypothetical protein
VIGLGAKEFASLAAALDGGLEIGLEVGEYAGGVFEGVEEDVVAFDGRPVGVLLADLEDEDDVVGEGADSLGYTGDFEREGCSMAAGIREHRLDLGLGCLGDRGLVAATHGLM